MTTVITILAENYVGKPGLLGEHGFGAMIESPRGQFLFDTGPGLSLPYNTEKMGIDLRGLDKIILSHGHYDHTGGLKWALEQTGPVQVVASNRVFTAHMARDANNTSKPPRYVGIPFTRQALEELGAEFVLLNKTTEISDGVWFVTNYSRRFEAAPNDPRLVLMENDRMVPDDLPDDSCLLIEANAGPVLMLGCTHSGLINTLMHLKNDLGISKVAAVIGGTHLMASDDTGIARAMDVFDEFSIDLIGTSHCTGFKASALLAAHFGKRFTLAATGSVITV